MSTRREAREWALQLLFQIDFNPIAAADLDRALDAFWQQQWRLRVDAADDAGAPPPAGADDAAPAARLAPPRLRAFAERLVRGVHARRDEIDARLAAYAENWPLQRMGAVDRNVLRLAIYEMFFESETPPVVCINEAVDLAKFFSSFDSGRFVNGILDRACRDVTRPPRSGRVRPARSARSARKPAAAPPAAAAAAP